MKNSRIWIILFLALLTINLVGLVWYFQNNKDSIIFEKQKEIEELSKKLKSTEAEYLENAKQFKYLLEVHLDNADVLKKYISDYDGMDSKTFEENTRKKVVKLELKIKEIEEKSH